MQVLKTIPVWMHTLLLVVAIVAAGWTACLLPDIHLLASSTSQSGDAAGSRGRTRMVCVAARRGAGGCFQIDVHAVTNAEFRRFVKATGYRTTAERKGSGDVYFAVSSKPEQVAGANWRQPFGLGAGIAPGDDMPVVQVSWHDAVAYARWSGAQLPTVEQWRAAADRPSSHKANPLSRETLSHSAHSNFYPAPFVAMAGCPTADGVFGMKQPAGIREWCMTGTKETSQARPICGCNFPDAILHEAGKSDNLTGFRCVAPAYSP